MIDVSEGSGARSAMSVVAEAVSHEARVDELLRFASDAGSEALLDSMADFVGAAVDAGHVGQPAGKGET